jgi:hypothetical protein
MPSANASSLVMDSDHRQVRNGERREWRRSACPLRARTTQRGYFFSVGYCISLSYEEELNETLRVIGLLNAPSPVATSSLAIAEHIVRIVGILAM